MIKSSDKILVLLIMLVSCSPFEGHRKLDWKKEWEKNGDKLKMLTRHIKENRDGKYQTGNNNFPGNFDYPFDEGFWIRYEGREITIDTNKISIRYYIDRGLLDHFSAFIYTKDSQEINGLDAKVAQDSRDYKIEDNWYIIND